MKRSVLIVDDDAALADNLAEIVEVLGVETVVAPDRQSALALAAERDFDVALIDVRLPDGDGVSLLETLRASCPFIQSVLLTGNATIEGAIAAVRGDAFAYVLKPVSPPDLLDTMTRALGQAALYRDKERLRVELERSEHRHRDLVESVPAFVLALDDAGRIATWNRQLEQVTGYSRDEMLGRDGRAFVGAVDGDAEPVTRDLPLKGGGARKVRWSRAGVPGQDERPGLYAVGIDVTDEDEMLRRLLRSERLAAVGTMATGLAHEVRNPLNSASLQLTLLERRLGRGDAADTILPIARIIKSEIDRLDRLVRDFLAFAQPRPIETRSIDAADLVRGVCELITPEAAAAHVAVTRELPAGPVRVLGDAERLRQVLLNLTRNALEAIGSTRGGNLHLRARETAGGVDIEVEDDGPGFAEDLPIFDAFFTTKEQGTGLGLALVHRIITDHGGTIRVSSRPGRTCFTLGLPRPVGG
jgi:signal transduction histidine kinase